MGAMRPSFGFRDHRSHQPSKCNYHKLQWFAYNLHCEASAYIGCGKPFSCSLLRKAF